MSHEFLTEKAIELNWKNHYEKDGRKSEHQREAEEKYDDALKTLGEMKIDNDFLKKIQTTVRNRPVLIEHSNTEMSKKEQYKALSISRCSACYSYITYIKIGRWHRYLMSIIDLFPRNELN